MFGIAKVNLGKLKLSSLRFFFATGIAFLAGTVFMFILLQDPSKNAISNKKK